MSKVAAAQRRWAIGLWVASAISIVGLGVLIVQVILTMIQTSANSAREEERWRAEQRRRQKEAVPKISYVEGSAKYEGGFTILTFCNESPGAHVIIYQLTYRITDAELLHRIHRRDPKRGVREGPTSKIPEDVVFFRKGCWTHDAYEFSAQVSYNIPPSEPNDLKLAIINPKWAGMHFVGHLEIQYDRGEPYGLNRVPIYGRRR